LRPRISGFSADNVNRIAKLNFGPVERKESIQASASPLREFENTKMWGTFARIKLHNPWPILILMFMTEKA